VIILLSCLGRSYLLGLSFRSSLVFTYLVTGEMSQDKLRFLLEDVNGALLLFWPSGVDEAIGLDFADFLNM
jgi:hypothetical protein